MLDLETIRVVVTLDECRSTASAAKKLPFSRATIRRRLDAIEAALGVKLFHRMATGLVPTEAGRVLARRGREMLIEAESLADTLRQVGGTPRGRVRLCVPAGLPPTAVAEFRRVMADILPRVRFDIRTGSCSPDQLFGEVDLVVTFGDPPSGPFEFIPIGVAHTRLLASPTYLASHAPIESPLQVKDHPLFVWIGPDEDVPTRLPRRDAPDLVIEPDFATDDIFTLRVMAARGDGLSYAPEGFSEPLEGVGAVVPVLPEVFGEERKFWIVVASATADAPAVRAVLDVMRTVAEAGGVTLA